MKLYTIQPATPLTPSPENLSQFPAVQAQTPSGGQPVVSANQFDVDIVAVHGLHGDYKTTWTWTEDTNRSEPRPSIFWLEDRRFLPSHVPKARVMSFSYDANIFSKSVADITDVALSLRTQLNAVRDGVSSRPIIFIAHSLGGIIVKETIKLAHEKSDTDLSQAITGVLFFAVPHKGSDLAQVGEIAANVTNVVSLGFRGNNKFTKALKTNSDELEKLSDAFENRANGILTLRTFYETEKYKGRIVVDKVSSKLRMGDDPSPLKADHVSICKFNESDEGNYIVVKKAINDLVKAAMDKGKGKMTENIRDLTPSEIDFMRDLYASTGCYESFPSPPEPGPRTCTWYLEHDKYKKWDQGEAPGLLLIMGEPGYGKSVFSSFLVNHLRHAQSAVDVCCFYFNEFQSSATAALCACLHRVLTSKRVVHQYALKEYQSRGIPLFEVLHLVWDIFVTAVGSDNVVCVLDGLDECKEETRRPLIDCLEKFYQSSSSRNLKFVITSRLYDSITDSFNSLPIEGVILKITSALIHKDIKNMVEDRVRKLKLLPVEKNRLAERLTKKADGTFLWISLTLEIISSDLEMSKLSLDTAMKSLPETINEAYERILRRVLPEHAERTRRLLHIIVAALRPLTMDDLKVAFYIQEDDESYEVVKSRQPFDIKLAIKNISGFFVHVVNSVVRFAHAMAREFLIQSDMPTRGDWLHSLKPCDSHLVMSKICITYLSLREFQSELPHSSQSSSTHMDEEHQFLSYAAIHWHTHHREALAGSTFMAEPAIVSKALKLCDPSEKQFSTWFPIYIEAAGNRMQLPRGWTIAMLASSLGFDDIITQLLDLGVADTNLEATNDEGNTALHLAALFNQEKVAKLLIERGASFVARNGRDEQVLHIIAESGSLESVARLLIARPQSAGVGWTDLLSPLVSFILWLVSWYKSESDTYLAKADLEARDKCGRTPLHIAARHAKDNIIKLLVDNGAILQAKDSAGFSPLHHAQAATEATVLLLLDAKAEIDARDNKGRTALHIAAKKGRACRVQQLLERGASRHIKDEDGRTPMDYAVSGKRAEEAERRFDEEIGVITINVFPPDDVPFQEQHGREYGTVIDLLTNSENLKSM